MQDLAFDNWEIDITKNHNVLKNKTKKIKMKKHFKDRDALVPQE